MHRVYTEIRGFGYDAWCTCGWSISSMTSFSDVVRYSILQHLQAARSR
jgi:hypothetical protein